MNAKRTAPVVLAVLLAFAAGVLFTSAGSSLFGLRALTAEGRADTGTTRLSASPETLEEAFVQVSERVNPTVVQIQTSQNAEPTAQAQRRRSAPQGQNPFEGTPFEDFFGGGPMGPGGAMPRSGLGSGVIVRPDGYILTNNHVVEGFDDFRVRFFDGSEQSATLVGRDPASDLAVIRVSGKTGLPTVSLGNADGLRVGQWVMAFGSPLTADLSNTVTAGIVSALGRFTPPTGDDPNALQLGDYIQTDAAINPGNSGGPLVNLRGELIGLNNAIYTRTGGNQGIGFAIPVDVVANVMEQLIASGSVRRALLGVSVGQASESIARALELPRGAAQVGSVSAGSAAARAGIREGDFILAVDGHPLRDWRELTQRIANKRPGDTATLSVQRDEERKTFQVTLGERDMAAAPSGDAEGAVDGRAPEAAPAAAKPGRFEEDLGFAYRDFATLTAAERQRFGLPRDFTRRAVVVTDIETSGAAFRDAGVRVGHLVTEINGQAVTDLASFERAYGAVRPGATFFVRLLQVTRDGATSTVRTALTKPG